MPPSRHDHNNHHHPPRSFSSVPLYRSVSTTTLALGFLILFHARPRYAHGRGLPMVTTVCMFCGSNIESSGDTHAVSARREPERAAGMMRRSVGDARAPRGKCTPDKSSFARRIINSPACFPFPRAPLSNVPIVLFSVSRVFEVRAAAKGTRNAVKKRWKASSSSCRRRNLLSGFLRGENLMDVQWRFTVCLFSLRRMTNAN